MTENLTSTLSPALAEFMTGNCYALAVRRASRRLIRLYDGALDQTGLTVSQLATLAWIKALKRPTVQKIADYMEMDQSAMSRGLAPLERDGLVAGAPHPTDKRRRVLSLTEAGEAALAQGAEAWETAQRQVEAQLSEAGLAQAINVINAMGLPDPS